MMAELFDEVEEMKEQYERVKRESARLGAVFHNNITRFGPEYYELEHNYLLSSTTTKPINLSPMIAELHEEIEGWEEQYERAKQKMARLRAVFRNNLRRFGPEYSWESRSK